MCLGRFSVLKNGKILKRKAAICVTFIYYYTPTRDETWKFKSIWNISGKNG